MQSRIDIESLRSLYRANSVARALFDHLATRNNNLSECTVDRLLTVLIGSGSDVKRNDLVRVLKELHGFGCLQFVSGRRGHPSRVTWRVGMVSLGKVASERGDVLEDMESPALRVANQLVKEAGESGGIELMRLAYPLRPELMVELTLPKDITVREVSRLADFLKTLPFEGGQTNP